MSLATVCGALAQPAAMAETFVHAQVEVICRTVSNELTNEKLRSFIEQVNVGKAKVAEVTAIAEEFYFKLIEMKADDARDSLKKSDVKHFQASELFLRAFEIEIATLLDVDGMPDFIVSEMKSYGRLIAKARAATTRLNGYVKQLTQQPKIFESDINFVALKVLASSTTEKLLTKKIH